MPHPGCVYIGDKSSILIQFEGTLDIVPDSRGGQHSSQVLYVPSLGFHILLVHEIYQSGMHVEFNSTSVNRTT